MAGFAQTSSNGVIHWRCEPHVTNAHQFLLARLSALVANFRTNGSVLTNAVKGNLGEFVAFYVGDALIYVGRHAFPANAKTPLADISRPDIDIVWLHLGVAPSDDILVVQEVKTTSDAALGMVTIP